MSREDILDTVIRGLLAKWGFEPEELHLALFARYGTVYKNLIASAYMTAERSYETLNACRVAAPGGL